jgi:hypothetical protein
MQRKNRPLPYIGTARTTGTAAIIAPPSQPSPKSRSGGIDSRTLAPRFLYNPSAHNAPIGYIRKGELEGVGGDDARTTTGTVPPSPPPPVDLASVDIPQDPQRKSGLKSVFCKARLFIPLLTEDNNILVFV